MSALRASVPLLTVDEMLSYRDTYLELPCEGFNVDTILSKAGRSASELIGSNLQSNSGLQQSENAFTIVNKAALSDQEKFRRNARSIMNRLTIRNRDELFKEMIEIGALEHHHISDCVEVVFDKALEEKLFLELYAIFFQQLFMVERERKLQGLIDASGPNLRTALIQKAQNEFNIAKGKFDNEFKEKNDLSDNEEYINLQHRFMDILMFVGNLLSQGTLSWKIFKSIVGELAPNASPVDEQNDFYLEGIEKLAVPCAGTLVKNHEMGTGDKHVGESLSTLNEFLKRMSTMVEQGLKKKPAKVSPRVYFLIANLIDQQKVKFVRENTIQKMTKAIREEERAKERPKESPVPSAPSSPTVQKPAANDIKWIKEVQPPTSFDGPAEAKVVSEVAAELRKENPDWAAVIISFSKMSEEHEGIINRQCAAFAVIKECCMSRNEQQRNEFALVTSQFSGPDRNKAFAWTLCFSFVDGYSSDCPLFYDRFFELAHQNFKAKDSIRDVFIKAVDYLHTVCVEDSCDAEEHSEAILKIFETKFLTSLPKDQLAEFPTATTYILNGLLKSKQTPLMMLVLADFVTTLISQGLFDKEAVKKWMDENAKKKDAQQIVGELGLVL